MSGIGSRCKNCGAPIDESAAVNGVVRCEYCGSYITVVRSVSPEARDYIVRGGQDLDLCKFDDALVAFSKAAELDPAEPEAYFGIALARARVMYLHDTVNNRLQPICHAVTDKKMLDDADFLRAYSLATADQKKVYIDRVSAIDRINAEFFELKNSGLMYDCFICTKVTDDATGQPTDDSHRALNIYTHLLKRGYKPFYSEAEIKGRAGTEYEAMILYALFTAKCMLIVCSDERYLGTKWVRNEYTRFSEMIADETKARDAMTIVYNGAVIERLPGRTGKLQGIDLSRPDAYTLIEDYLRRHIVAAKPAGKFCVACGKENPPAAVCCMYCGGREFAATYEKSVELRMQRKYEAQYAARTADGQAELMRRREEEERRKREEAKLSEEAKRLQAEEQKRREAEAKRRLEEENKKRMIQRVADGELVLLQNGRYALFGMYPQTIKPASVTVTHGTPYCTGSDGNLYARAVVPRNLMSDHELKFSDGTPIVPGNEYFFRVEPIVWDCLATPTYATLVSRFIIDAGDFDEKSNNYEKSAIRGWLNGEFINAAFKPAAAARISQHSIRNDRSMLGSAGFYRNKYLCKDTNDKVFFTERRRGGVLLQNGRTAQKGVHRLRLGAWRLCFEKRQRRLVHTLAVS